MTNRAIIIGSGASLRQNQWDINIENLPIWSILKDELTIGCNWSYKWFNSTVLMYSDYQWYVTEKENLKNVPLILGKKDGYYHRKDSEKIDKNVILLDECKHTKRLKYNTNKAGMHPTYWGKDAWTKGFYCSQLIGIKALNLAIALNSKEIYLLGYDACDINGHTHFYEDTDTGTYMWNNHKHCGVGKDDKGRYKTGNYNKIEELNKFYFQPFEQELKNGIKIYNVSLQSKIDTFPKISYDEFYKHLKNNSSQVNHEDIRKEIRDKLCK